MDSTSIKAIQDCEASHRINDVLLNNPKLKFIAAPPAIELKSLEKFNAIRFSYRANYKTTSLDNFIAYALNYIKPGNMAFVQPDEMTARIIFDLGTIQEPGHCTHSSQLKLEQTAAYIALQKISDVELSQQQVAEFLEDWRHIVSASGPQNDDGTWSDFIPLVKAINAIRKIKIEALASKETTSSQFGASQSSLESIDVRGDDLPPAFIHFNCEPYFALPLRTFSLRLSVVNKQRPCLILRIVRAEEHREQMAKQLANLVASKLSEAKEQITVLIGEYSV